MKVSESYSIHINARPQEVFAYAADLTRHGEWSAMPLSVEALSAAPVAVGSKYRSTGDDNFGKGHMNELEVIEIVPPQRFVFTSHDARMPNPMRHELEVAPNGDGTLLTRRFETDLPLLNGLMFKFVLLPRYGNPSMRLAMQRLKERLESH